MRRLAISIDGLGVLIGEITWKVNKPFLVVLCLLFLDNIKISPEAGKKHGNGGSV